MGIEPVRNSEQSAQKHIRGEGAMFDSEGDFRRQAVHALFDHLTDISEGIIVVDKEARIAWLDEKYKQLLGVGDEAIGRMVEDIIPNSQLRRVIASGKPIVLDIMAFGTRSMVVVRLPLRDADGEVDGAMGLVLYDRADHIKQLFMKLNKVHDDDSQVRRDSLRDRRPRYRFSDFRGQSAAAAEVLRRARRAADLEATTLLLGETGTGKELIAQAIHAASRRAGKPMVCVNVAAIPENLLEAEFFGAAPGAYTGADRRGRDGKFLLAEGGTLFLDEIGDMPLSLQGKLLRVVQEREFEPLGSNRLHATDVRIIAATSHDLGERVRNGGFRADLYYRLNVIPITLPPLRRRVEDIEDLAAGFVEQFRRDNGQGPRGITAAAVTVLQSYDWPGNVRELANVLHHACAFCQADRLNAADLPDLGNSADRPPAPPLATAVDHAERDAIRLSLAAAKGNKTLAASQLGISRTSLYERIRTLGI